MYSVKKTDENIFNKQEQKKMSCISQFNKNKFNCLKPRRLTSAPPAKLTFMAASVKYDNNDAFFVLKPCNGRIAKKVENGKVEWKLNLTITDEEDLAGLKRLSECVYESVEKYSTEFERRGFKASEPYGCRGVYFYPMDKESKQLIEGSNPMMSLRIQLPDPNKPNNTSRFQRIINDPVYDDNGLTVKPAETTDVNPTEWNNKKVECCVIFRVQDICSAGKEINSRLFVGNCMILKVLEQSSSNVLESDFMKKYLQNNPGLSKTLDEHWKTIQSNQTIYQENEANTQKSTATPAPIQQPPMTHPGFQQNFQQPVPGFQPQMGYPQMMNPMAYQQQMPPQPQAPPTSINMAHYHNVSTL